MEKVKSIQQTISLVHKDTPDDKIQDNLTLFEKELNYNNFYQIPKNNLTNLMSQIWKNLLYLTSNKDSSISISVSRTIGRFLYSLTPFFPDEMSISFTNTLTNNKFESKSFPCICSSFMFLSKYTALPFLSQFIHLARFNTFFASSDTSSLDHIPGIISKLGNTTLEWLEDVMTRFIRLNSINAHRQFNRSIASIIEHYPETLYKTFLKETCSDQETIHKNIQMFAYVFNTTKLPKLDFDFKKIGIECIKQLARNDGIASLDNALQVLTALNDYFTVDTKINGDNVVIFIDEEKAELPLATLKKVINFFKLETLPLELIKPAENDGALLLTAKLSNIGNQINKNIIKYEDYLPIFNSAIGMKYSDRMSPYLRCLSQCINTVMDNRTHEVARMIREITLGTVKTWNHALDIAIIFDSMDENKAYNCLGRNFIAEEVLQLFDFLMFNNDNLDKKVISILNKATLNEELINTVSQNIDFFDSKKLVQYIKGFTAIKNAPNWVINCLCELISYETNVDSLEVFFKFFAVYSKSIEPSNRKKIQEIAIDLIRSAFTVYSQQEWIGQKHFIEQMNAKSEQLSADLVTTTERLQFFTIIDSAINLLSELNLSNSTDNELINELTTHFNDLFILSEKGASSFLLNHWNEIDRDSREHILSKGSDILKCAGDVEVHKVWCKVCLKIEGIYKITQFSATVGFLHVVASQALVYPTRTQTKSLAIFSVFLWKTLTKASAIIVDFYNLIDDKQKEEFIESIKQEDLVVFNDLLKIITRPVSEEQGKTEKMEINLAYKEEQLNEENVFDVLFNFVQNGTKEQVANLVRSIGQKEIVINKIDELFIPRMFEEVFLIMKKRKFANIKDCLSYARTKTRNNSISYLQDLLNNKEKTEEQLIDEALTPREGERKVKKQELLDFCSIISEINFDKNMLSTKVFTFLTNQQNLDEETEEIKSTRIPVLMRLIATAAKECVGFPASLEVLETLTKELKKCFRSLNIDEVALTFQQIIGKELPKKEHISFIFKLFQRSSAYSKGYGYLVTMLSQNIDILDSLGKGFDIDPSSIMNEIIQLYIQVPSLMNECARIQSATNNLKLQNSTIKTIFDYISDKSNILCNEVICCLSNISQVQSIQSFIWKNAHFMLEANTSSANFISLSSFYPIILLSCPSTYPLLNATKEKIISMFSEATTPYIFISCIEALDAFCKRSKMEEYTQSEQKEKKNSKQKLTQADEKTEFIAACIKSFADSLKEHDSYYVAQCVSILCDRISIFQSPLESLNVIIDYIVDKCRFAALFSTFCTIAKKTSKKTSSKEVIDIIQHKMKDAKKGNSVIKFLNGSLDKAEIDNVLSINQ